MVNDKVDDKVTICMQGECFTLDREELVGVPDSLLCKCFDPDSALVMLPSAKDGMYHFDRSAAVFRRVVLPFVRRGTLDLSGVDALEALRELDYFGLLKDTVFHPLALGESEARVLCKVMVDRLARTMGEKHSCRFLLFAERADWDLLHPGTDVGVLVGTLSKLFRSTALVEYGLDLSWTVYDACVYQCPVRKDWRASKEDLPVYAYTHFYRTPPVDMAPVHVCTVKAVDVTPSMYLLDVREADVTLGEGEGAGAPVKAHFLVHYDLLQRQVVVKCKVVKIGPWTTYSSYVAHLVVVRKHAPAPSLPLSPDTTYLVSSNVLRLWDGLSVKHGDRGVSFPCHDYDVHVVVYSYPVSMEKFSVKDPHTKKMMKRDERTRTLCRLEAVALRP